MPTTTSIGLELWTADEFLDWLEPGVFADLIDGEILMHSPDKLPEPASGGLYRASRARGVVHHEVIAARMSQRSVVMPDIAFYTREQESMFQEMHIPVAPTGSRKSFHRPRFWVKRIWLDRQLRANPTVAEALAELVA